MIFDLSPKAQPAKSGDGSYAYEKSIGASPFAPLKTKRVPLEAQGRGAAFCGSYFFIRVDLSPRLGLECKNRVK